VTTSDEEASGETYSRCFEKISQWKAPLNPY
jgi:hypothetical protein